MTRINTNVSALIAQHNLNKSNLDVSQSLLRLSTGLKINRGADDPAGLIVSERLRTEISGVNQAIDNIERASNVIATTEAALQEINTLLVSIKSLTIEAANTGAFSEQEIEANQLQIDSAVESITRISNTASFAGLKLLNGSLDYLTSGLDTSQISDVRINGANFGTNDSIPVTVEVLNSAETAQLFISGNTAGSTGALLSSVTVEVQGNYGVQVFEFVSGTALSAVVAAINTTADATGVSASLVDAADQTSGMILTSTAYGSDSFVSVRKMDGGSFFQTFDAQGGSAVARDIGEDVLALVNGNLAIGDGLDVSLKTTTLNINMTLTSAAAQTLNTPYAFSITGGGATYQIGPEISSSQQVGFGIQSVAASHLGTRAIGFLNSIVTGGDNSLLTGKAREAGDIIDAAIDQITTLRGRLGAFEKNTLQTTLRSTQIALENLTASESQIRDADFAEETSSLTRAQILQQAGTSTLAIANNQASSVLSLLQ
ncbi:MAG: flagellin [Phycisphaeraceae bacterium]|nr:flagellin [Phycisphaeraceae bacterium]